MTYSTLYKSAKFLLGASQLHQLPADNGIEIAFAGRSNAGKSSVLNVLTQQNHLARTSKTPGRTQQINVFSLDDTRRFIDLPGYGYAKVPQNVKKAWQKTLDQYLQTRHSLQALILVMDVRHPLKAFDQMMIDWAIACQLPMHILLNKADKLKKMAASKTLLETRRILAPYSQLISLQLFSALKKQGLDECYQFLNQYLQT